MTGKASQETAISGSCQQNLVGICNSVWVWWLFMGWIPRWGSLWMVIPSVSAPNFVFVSPSIEFSEVCFDCPKAINELCTLCLGASLFVSAGELTGLLLCFLAGCSLFSTSTSFYQQQRYTTVRLTGNTAISSMQPFLASWLCSYSQAAWVQGVAGLSQLRTSWRMKESLPGCAFKP